MALFFDYKDTVPEIHPEIIEILQRFNDKFITSDNLVERDIGDCISPPQKIVTCDCGHSHNCKTNIDQRLTPEQHKKIKLYEDNGLEIKDKCLSFHRDGSTSVIIKIAVIPGKIPIIDKLNELWKNRRQNKVLTDNETLFYHFMDIFHFEFLANKKKYFGI